MQSQTVIVIPKVDSVIEIQFLLDLSVTHLFGEVKFLKSYSVYLTLIQKC